MKKIFLLLMLFISIKGIAATYYISPTGNNGNDGSINSPWLTLTYACSQVTSAGNTIYVKTGNYNETSQSVLAVGVSLVGEGTTNSIVTFHYTNSDYPCIKMYSATQGTNGNQSISYIKFDGDNLFSYMAIEINARSNVKIHHCEFVNFLTKGITFSGIPFGTSVVTTHATGNEFHNNVVTNCGGYGVAQYGNLKIGGQSGMLVYGNTITQLDRATHLNGSCISFESPGDVKGLKIYNNTLTVPPQGSTRWDFAIELFELRGGIEIHDNVINGCVDISSYSTGTGICNDAGGYGYAIKVYNNTIGQPSLTNQDEVGIDFEHDIVGGTYVYNNTIQNVKRGVVFSFITNTVMEDVYVHNNVIKNLGQVGSVIGYGINIGSSSGHTVDNFNLWNNTIYAGTSGTPTDAIYLTGGTVPTLSIRNNIIQGFDNTAVRLNNSTISTLSIENNNFYGNNATISTAASTITSNTTQNNITSDPLFISSSDFQLQATSPAINVGIGVGLTSDYLGNAIVGLPDIGAYEYGSSPEIKVPMEHLGKILTYDGKPLFAP